MIDFVCPKGFDGTIESDSRTLLRSVAMVSLLIVFVFAAGQSTQAQDEQLWNRLYVTNFDSNTVSVIDLNASQILATIPVGVGPTAMAVTPDHEHVYVSNIWSGEISVISTASNSVEKTIPFPSFYGRGAPFGLAMAPDGTKVLANNLADGTVRVIDTTTNTVTAIITVAYDWALRYITISPDGDYAYVVGGGDGKITVIRMSDYSLVTKITNLQGARHLNMTPDGSRLYVASEILNCVYVIDTTTYARIATIDFPSGSWTTTIDIDATGKFAIVTNYYGKVSLVDIDPKSPTYHQITAQIPPSSFYQYCAVISPDARFAYLSNQADRGPSPNSINVIDIAKDSPTNNTIIKSIAVGKRPFGVAVVRQLPPPGQ